MTPPVLVGHVKKRERIRDPGMCTHHVDMAELSHAHLDCPTAVVVDRYVADEWDAPFPEASGRRLQLVSVPIKGYYRRALIKEAPYDAQTDPLRCTSYNDALSAELRHVRLLGCWCLDG
jgi:hypothetical protein